MSIDHDAIQRQEDSDREADRIERNWEKSGTGIQRPSNQELARRFARLYEPNNVMRRLKLEGIMAKGAEFDNSVRRFMIERLDDE